MSVIENGIVYSVEESDKYKIKTFKCMEYSLNSILKAIKTNTTTNISGQIYKESYDSIPIEIVNPIEIFINNQKITEISPIEGLININIDIVDIENINLYFREKENNNIFGYYEIRGESNV